VRTRRECTRIVPHTSDSPTIQRKRFMITIRRLDFMGPDKREAENCGK
jgi:hypothetical protein